MKNLFCFAIAAVMFVGLGSTAEASIFYENLEAFKTGVFGREDNRLSDQSVGFFNFAASRTASEYYGPSDGDLNGLAKKNKGRGSGSWRDSDGPNQFEVN